MSPQTSPIDSASEKKLSQTKAILYLLQTNLEELKDEVDRSYELLAIGEKTAFTKSLEKRLENPLGEVVNMSQRIKEEIKSIINTFVTAFFKINSDLIQSVLKGYTSNNDLHYSVILKQDTFENREKILSFFHKFDLLEISNTHPVLFQFIPIEFKDKVLNSEELNLN